MYKCKIVDVLDLNRKSKTDDASRGRIGLVGTFQFIPTSNYDNKLSNYDSRYRALFCTKKYIKFITSYVDEWILTRNGAELLTENSIYVLEDYWADET